MIDLCDKLTGQEKSAIECYCEYAYTHFEDPARLVPFHERFNEWNKAKQELYDIFNHNFILEKPICLAEHSDAWIEQFNVLYRYGFFNALSNEFIIPADQMKEYFSAEDLSRNILSKDITLYPRLSLIEPIQLKRGMKVMKAFSKVAKVAHLESSFEDMRLKHSELRQTDTLEGTLCLSIHPMDYLTMSDNSYGWSSCMSIAEGGDYCAGVIEMMNSPIVVCVYLKGTKPFITNETLNYSWNSKKWRCLFIVSNDMIVPVKGYPYQSGALESIALEWLKSLLEARGYTYHETPMYPKYFGNRDFPSYAYYADDEQHVRLDFRTHIMYNDMGVTPHFYYISQKLYDESKQAKAGKNIEVLYSGYFTCMWCGAKMTEIDKMELITCCDCRRDWYCDICGHKQSSPDNLLPYLQGMRICKRCHKQTLKTLDGYDRLKQDCIQVIAIPSFDLFDYIALDENSNYYVGQMPNIHFPTAYVSRSDIEEPTYFTYHPYNEFLEAFNKYLPEYFNIKPEQAGADYITGNWKFKRLGVYKNIYVESTILFVEFDALTEAGKERFGLHGISRWEREPFEEQLRELKTAIICEGYSCQSWIDYTSPLASFTI